MNKVIIFIALLLFPLGALNARAATKPGAKPNILVILTDDQGRGDYSAFGTKDIRTPHLDHLFSEGLTFQNFFANSCVCSPSRASLLTGCYPDRVGVPGVIREETPDDSWGYFSPSATLLPQLLKQAGYHSALIGKWHLGIGSPNTPTERGFDFFHGFLGDMMDDYWTHLRHGRNFMRRNQEVVDPPGHATDIFTSWACDYLDEQAKAGGPFFLYLAYNAPHDPIQPPPEWLEKVKQREPGLSEKRARIVALIEHLDAGIGQVLAELDRTGLASNTLVIFTSDNGGNLAFGANNGPWRSGKGHMYEGGLRVPGAARWPGVIKPGASTGRVTLTMDIFATACAVAGVQPPPNIDGISFLPALRGEDEAHARRDCYFVRREGGPAYGGKTIEAFRRGDWKLLQDSPFAPLELYNLQSDPQEATDLAARNRLIFNDLAAGLRQQIQRGGATPWQQGGPVGGPSASINVQADHVIGPVSRLLTGACIEDVNHEIYGGIYSQMIFGEDFQEPALSPAISGSNVMEVSGLWRAVRRGTAAGRFELVTNRPFAGRQSQWVSFDSGEGEWGLENQGLNRWGLNFAADKPYEGYVWARAGKRTELIVALESRDGSQVYAQTPVVVAGDDWQRLDFTLTPEVADHAGRFALKLKRPGSVTLGHAFLQPGEWGRFKGLPVRRDVAEGLIGQGITVLRYGGSMVNSDGYRWKNMIGPRDRRPPYAGTWYRYSSDGWGIPDFMDFCEAAGFEYIPDFNMSETPQDMADFIEYAKGAADTEWGRRRVADGHPQPYHLHYIELGNEERVDEKYANKFEALAKAIWAKDKDIIPVVGDFAYGRQIQDPLHFTGADSGITTLAAHRRILQLAKASNGEVWFDVHVNTDQPVPTNATLAGMFSFTDALDKLADGARHAVVVFELNAGNHSQKRALANAQAILAIERDGRIPIVTSANGLQPDGQNDNGWNQGLLFLNPSQVWLQPPGYITQMLSHQYLPRRVNCDVLGAEAGLDAMATRSDDGRTLVLQVVNAMNKAVTAQIQLTGFVPGNPVSQEIELSGDLTAVNTSANPEMIVPQKSLWQHGSKDGPTTHVFPPHSFTVLRFE